MSIDNIQSNIVAEFETFKDWSDRYKHIIKLGRELSDFPDELKTEDNKLHGCQSQVWLTAKLDGDKVNFQADSDAMIVRGLIALVLKVYSGHTPDEILATEPKFIEEIGMSNHLSMTRSNGLTAMIKQIKFYALAFKTLLDRQKGA